MFERLSFNKIIAETIATIGSRYNNNAVRAEPIFLTANS